MALPFGDNFWVRASFALSPPPPSPSSQGDGGYEALENKLVESGKSMATFVAYFTDMATAEAKYAAKIEKINKKYIPGVTEYRYRFILYLYFKFWLD